LYNIGSVTEQPKNIKRVTHDPREWRKFFLFFPREDKRKLEKKFRVDILNDMPEKNDPRGRQTTGSRHFYDFAEMPKLLSVINKADGR